MKYEQSHAKWRKSKRNWSMLMSSQDTTLLLYLVMRKRMSFLDVNIIREKDEFTTSVYRKPTFSGIYTHFDSFLPSSNKIGLLHTLLYRCFQICSDWTKFHLELVKLTRIMVILRTLLIIVLKCFWIRNIEYKKKW